MGIYTRQKDWEEKNNLETYEKKQEEWIRETGLKCGDKVKIIRKVESHEEGWGDEWSSGEMHDWVGQTVEVMAFNGRFGIELTRDGDQSWLFPYFVLEPIKETPAIRQFDSGATRDVADHKYDYEAFESPLVLNRFAKYMHKHRKQKDGTIREGDNWQKGIPNKELMKSMWRHVFDVGAILRGYKCYEYYDTRTGEPKNPIDLQEALCAIRFNVNGLLHNLLKDEGKPLANGEKEGD